MTNRAVLDQKISSIQKYLKILKGFQKYSLEDITQNFILRGAVERYLYLFVQATIDLTEAIIVFKNFRKPGVYSEAFEILQEEDFLAPVLTEKLIKMAKFRNVIAHDYEKLNYIIVYDVLQKGLEDVEKFLKIVEARL